MTDKQKTANAIDMILYTFLIPTLTLLGLIIADQKSGWVVALMLAILLMSERAHRRRTNPHTYA